MTSGRSVNRDPRHLHIVREAVPDPLAILLAIPPTLETIATQFHCEILEHLALHESTGRPLPDWLDADLIEEVTGSRCVRRIPPAHAAVIVGVPDSQRHDRIAHSVRAAGRHP